MTLPSLEGVGRFGPAARKRLVHYLTRPEREITIKTGSAIRQDDPGYVTEIQFPAIRKPA